MLQVFQTEISPPLPASIICRMHLYLMRRCLPGAGTHRAAVWDSKPHSKSKARILTKQTNEWNFRCVLFDFWPNWFASRCHRCSCYLCIDVVLSMRLIRDFMQALDMMLWSSKSIASPVQSHEIEIFPGIPQFSGIRNSDWYPWHNPGFPESAARICPNKNFASFWQIALQVSSRPRSKIALLISTHHPSTHPSPSKSIQLWLDPLDPLLHVYRLQCFDVAPVEGSDQGGHGVVRKGWVQQQHCMVVLRGKTWATNSNHSHPSCGTCSDFNLFLKITRT